MRSILMTIIGIALLAGYLEWTSQHSQQPPMQQLRVSVGSAKVVRDKPVRLLPAKIPTAAEPKKTPADNNLISKTPLDLTIPSLGNKPDASFPSRHQRTHDWLKKPNPKEQISYNAELVFDKKEGSSVKGGKVNIKIPFG